MKKSSIKLRIILWYSLILILISGIVLTIMISVSQQMLSRDIGDRITRTVNDLTHKLEGPEGKGGGLPVMGMYKQGVHMMIYDENEKLLSGRVPFDLSQSMYFRDNYLETISDSGNKYYVYTKKTRKLQSGSAYWVRGIVSVTDENFAIQSAARTNIVLTVMMLLVAAAGGYVILKRALAPVGKISRTAQQISESRDLSQRIRIGDGGDEIHDLANTFDHMLDKIEQTMEREKQFTSDASHELRTPVSVILSECEYMTDCAKEYGEMKESAVSIKEQAEKMSKLISELLMISRMDKNTLKATFEEIDVSELLGFICEEQEEIHSKAITLHRAIAPGIKAQADRFLLARLCINLISNAYTYGREGGNITVSLSEQGDQIMLRVLDNGIGIATEHLEKIWERFYQVDPSRTANENGNMGLGLSMVQWIADCHNGTMRVDSMLDVGSTFTFAMPKKQADIDVEKM